MANVDYTDGIYTKLTVSGSPVLTTLTGGLYKRKALKAGGINPTDTPAVYNNTRVKPHGVVKGRLPVPMQGILALRVPKSQFVSVKQVVEIWLFTDVSADTAVLYTAAGHIYDLLQDKRISGSAWKIEYTGGGASLDLAPENNKLWFMRLDYEVTGAMK